MKKFFFSLVALMVAAVSFAQSTLVATLTHNEDVTMYYGTYALRDAYNAAASGDVINLSGGGFQAVDIKKAITLRGTGIDEAIPTTILSGFRINIPSDDTNRFSMEGIRIPSTITMEGSYQNPYFLKCLIGEVSYNGGPIIKNAMFVNCKIIGNYFYFQGTSTVQFINCYVTGLINDSESTSSASFINCVVRPRQGFYSDLLRSCQFMNCIFYNHNGQSHSLPSSTVASNCIVINENGLSDNFLNNSQINPNCGFASYTEMFKDFIGTYSDAQTFELTEEGKTRLLGTDGTEIGMHGGLMPYTSTPSYPRITKMNVASKTTADGKLSVEIEVSAAE